MSDDDLEAKLDNLAHQNDIISHENELLESYLQNNGQPATDSDDEEKATDGDKKIGGSRQCRVRPQAMLTIHQKTDICCTELETVLKELEETKHSSERLIDTLRAVLEEADIRIAELKKDAYEFKRDIVGGAENLRTGKTIAEKMIRYLEDKLRQKDAIVEKLRLKNATLKSQAQKIDAQLRHREEIGGAFHDIDFHQLQIQNKQYVAKSEERNEELLRLKQSTGRTIQMLNNLKKRLHEQLEESTSLQGGIRSYIDLNKKVIKKIALVEDRSQRETKYLQSLQNQQAAEPSKDMPQILDYVAQKAKMYDLQQDVKNYERKIEIAERTLKFYRTKHTKI